MSQDNFFNAIALQNAQFICQKKNSDRELKIFLKANYVRYTRNTLAKFYKQSFLEK